MRGQLHYYAIWDLLGIFLGFYRNKIAGQHSLGYPLSFLSHYLERLETSLVYLPWDFLGIFLGFCVFFLSGFFRNDLFLDSEQDKRNQIIIIHIDIRKLHRINF